MAGFVASALPQLLVRLDSIFAGQNTNQSAEYYYPGTTIRAIMENQNVKTNDVLEGGVCQSVKAWWVEGGSTTIVYSGAVADPAETCTLTACSLAQTEAKTYDKNFHIHACHSAVSPRCDNALEFAEEGAHGFLRMRKDILKELNELGVTLLTNNVQANQSTGFDPAIIGTSVLGGNRLKMSPTNFNNLDNLIQLDILRHENYLFNEALYINEGLNFFTSSQKAFFARNAPEGGTAFTTGQGIAPNMKWDREGGLFLGRNSTFIVNPDTLLFFNTTYSPGMEPILVNPSTNTWTYKMADPELMYRKNGVLVPIEYEIEYGYVCSPTRDTLGRMVFTHTWKMKLLGGLHLAPAGLAPLSNTPAAHPITGVVEIVAEV
jgi:hypothetical protein